ncbi:MAG TPA: replicative DNA helicase [Candidatus Omnitrophota bacterium]|nr:replicative DNA helicase [Candidatus Omnitrophota bacterium]
MGNEEIRVPPQNVDAEKALLGAMMIDEEAIGTAIEHLDSFYFYETRHQKVFDAVRDLYAQRKNVDIITLSDFLTGKGILEAVGGLSYLTELADFVPTSANARYYVDIVKEKGIQRRLIKNSTEIISKSYGTDVNVDELVDAAEQLIFEIATAKQRQQAVHVKDIIKTAIETIDQLYQHKQAITGVATGFIDFDRMTSGLQKSDLIIIAGRPSMGKSALAGSICEYAAIHGNVPVAIFSLEMSKEQLVQRMLCSQAQVDAHKVRTGFLSPSEWPLLTKAAGKLSNVPIFIDDTPAISALELRAKARRLKTSHNIGLIVVDYLQLMEASARTESRQQEISEISRSLKALARELNTPLIAISQLSRAVESRQDHRPQLSDLRESGAIEQDADVVVLLMREEQYNPTPENQGIAEAIIAKQRNGPTGSVKLKFFKEFVKFANLETVHHQ